MNVRPHPAAIAAELTADERRYLLELPADGPAALPAVTVSSALLLNHGIPLITIVGDWAYATRIGGQVKKHLEAISRPARALHEARP